MDTQTRLYAVIGDPVGHSLGPVMHNRAFALTGYNGAYLAFRVTDLAAAVKGVRALGLGGVSVTIPHKEAVMAFLDDIDPAARAIGAVNTVVNRGGCLTGYNTDCAGAMAALAEKTDIRGKSVWIIGAGGAARAVGYGVVAGGGRLTIVNRSREKGRRLAADLGAGFVPLAHVEAAACDVLINTTAVGMAPAVDAMPVPAGSITAPMVVMDVVYNPLKTRLLAEADGRGCATVDGLAMFVYQGAAQFELWTQQKAPLKAMRTAVAGALGEGS